MPEALGRLAWHKNGDVPHDRICNVHSNGRMDMMFQPNNEQPSRNPTEIYREAERSFLAQV